MKHVHGSGWCWAVLLLATMAVHTAADLSMAEASDADAGVLRDAFRMDQCDYAATYPVRPQEGAGKLADGGYAAKGASIERADLRCKTAMGTATVDRVTHRGGYKYVRHDLLGAFANFATLNRIPGSPGESLAPVRTGSWSGDPAAADVVYAAVKEKASPLTGLVGWHAVKDGKEVTVIIGFIGFNGLPGKVVEKYLQDYPSDMKRGAPAVDEWQEADIAKWKDILTTSPDDTHAVDIGVAQLRRYDRAAFGLSDALHKRGDTQAFKQAVEEVIKRMDAWAAEHKKGE